MIVAEYVNHLWIKINSDDLKLSHNILCHKTDNYIEVYEYFKNKYNIEILSANYSSTDYGVKLKLILKEKEISVSTIIKISKDAIFGSESYFYSDNGAEYSYSYILLDIDQTIEKL